MALRTRVSRASNIRVCRHPIPWTPSRPHSSFEPLIQLDPDGGRRRLAERGPHCNRGKIVSRHYSRVDQHSAFTTPLLPQCKHFSHGDGVVSRLPLVEKRQEAIRAEKGTRRKWSQYLSGTVKKVSRCHVFVCVARCLPFIRLSDDLVARQAGNHQ